VIYICNFAASKYASHSEKIVLQKQNNMSDGILRLNVGGRQFHVGYDTILQYPNSFLAKLITDPFEKQYEYFIDRDADMFESILTFYRNGRIYPQESSKMRKLKDEAKFFNLFDDMFPLDANDDQFIECRKLFYDVCDSCSKIYMLSTMAYERIEFLSITGRGILEIDGVVIWDARVTDHMDIASKKKLLNAKSEICKDLNGIVIPGGKLKKIVLKSLDSSTVKLTYQRVYTFHNNERL
jgi:hypothetical protein